MTEIYQLQNLWNIQVFGWSKC